MTTAAAPRLSGTVVHLTYDWTRPDLAPAPGVGDLLVTDAGTHYLIEAARRVARRQRLTAGERWAYRCLRLDPECVQAAIDDCWTNDGRIEGLRWHTRRRRTR